MKPSDVERSARLKKWADAVQSALGTKEEITLYELSSLYQVKSEMLGSIIETLIKEGYLTNARLEGGILRVEQIKPVIEEKPAVAHGGNEHKAMIFEAVRMRGETDQLMSPAWVFGPLLSVVISISTLILMSVVIKPQATITAPMIILLVVGYVAAVVLTVIPLYFLIKRRSTHFRRDCTLRDGIIQYLKTIAVSRGKETEITSEIATMNILHSEATGEEQEKSAVMWTILAILVPFVSLYVWYFLTKDMPNHDHKQHSFMQQTQSAGTKLGMILVVPTWKALPGRSFFLYFILTLVTGGLFALYWYYILIKDPNEHFKTQRQFEDQLVSAISV